MPKLSRELVHLLKNQGKTFEEIGNMFGLSRQRIHAIYSGYTAVYRKTERYKMYHRHYRNHEKGSKPYKSCDYCQYSIRQYGYQD